MIIATSMASLLPKTAPHVHPLANPSSPVNAFFPFRFHCLNASLPRPILFPLKVASSSDADSLHGKPLVSQGKGILEEHGYAYEDEEDEEEEEEKMVDWEDQILEDTVPLVGFVRMILHSGQYESGDRLNPDHEKTILEKLLPFHPEFEKKIGCGIDHITIGYHPDFQHSRCLFIVRQDGELIDFSYWKCIKGLIRKNYPLYADSFILRHFRKKSRNL
ncbi:protein DCL, chloroplastic [Abrus precatorius]|uniref:Protein DCL, chloroplastic n=1 Tax=Abrus precatorius TaxID=3816 RepID=A0A8B8LDA4_ABRPR|nr:protein DCL, chloroplastic [Abrus precatorius]XP_027354188.1 protein DCL, chloroplastic [Abrus precatorius]